MSVLKNSVGVWAFGPAVTRFVPPGYHPEVADEPMVDKTRRGVMRRGACKTFSMAWSTTTPAR